MTIDIAKLRAETLALLDGTTPGPWEIRPAERWGDRVTEYYHEVWDDDCNIIAGEVTRAHRDGGRKNIRLIAAAPTLASDTLRLLDEIERLRADRDQGAKDYCDLMEQRDRQHVKIAKLKAALRPFVKYVHDDLRRGNATYELVAVDRHGGGLIGAEDLRRARAALSKGDPA